MKMKKICKRKNSEGFTLIEAIISLAVLSIASVFILQMFVTAAQLNSNARDIDRADALVSSVMEGFYTMNDPREYAESSVFPYSAEVDGELRMQIYYDGDWQRCPREDAVFVMHCVIRLEEEGPIVPVGVQTDVTTQGGLYSLTGQMLPMDGDTPLVTNTTCVYFPALTGEVTL